MKNLLLKYMTRFTPLNEADQQTILDEILVEAYKKGTVLLRQGDVPAKCYFVLKGCVRQYSVDEGGKEITSNFYTEEQAISMFVHPKPSEYAFMCLEDSCLVVGDLYTEEEMYRKHRQLELMTRKMIEESFGQMQEEFAAFIASTPEERFKSMLRNRPQLIDRVPQHQLASFLGLTPESLSRIKKRVQSS
ncbi:Crp/Fnr family transcriptional regulator [Paenibacillus harenae]|uniref:Crp/Fnr family transcriptional regulator n=1 Tax=Paenibacillus harenae TaxID=306543 RepID=UPI00041A7CAE|nr:Crp/Fnr family transcriptional regulator [Paenibacillus harenae]